MKRRRNIIIVAILLFFAVVTVLSIRINSIYPREEEIVYTMEERVPYEDDVFIKVNNARFLTTEEKVDIHPNESEKGVIFESLVVSVTAVNSGEDEKTVELYPIMLESGTFANGNELYAMLRINEDEKSKTLMPTLKPGESITILIPFLMANIRFKPDDWAHVKEREFKLVFNLYPQKKSIELSVNE